MTNIYTRFHFVFWDEKGREEENYSFETPTAPSNDAMTKFN